MLCECPYCKMSLKNVSNNGNHVRWCSLNPKVIARKKVKRYCSLCHKEIISEKKRTRCDECKHKHTEHTKQQMSKKRSEWLRKNPDKHPWRKKEKFISIPCEKFKKYLDSIGLKYISEYNTYSETKRNFSIDIAFPDIKVGIEINGNQHYNKDGSLKDYYQIRHNIIESHGWKLLEIHYSDCFNIESVQNIIKFYDQPDYFEYFCENEKRKNKKELALLAKECKAQKVKEDRTKKIEQIKNKIISSNVDFSKFGWVCKISAITGILPSRVHIFMKMHMKDFYDTKCFKRKTPRK